MGETAPDKRLTLCRPVVLIGMMGAGKTAVGKALAARLDVPLRDSDAEIVAASKLSIAEIFERYGEAFFREKESQVIERLLGGAVCVLSTGGGAWMSERNRSLLMAQAEVVWLDADLELLWSRVRHKSTRPLLQTSDPKRTLTEIYTARGPVYAMAPWHLQVDPEWSIDDTTTTVLEVLQKSGAVRPVSEVR